MESPQERLGGASLEDVSDLVRPLHHDRLHRMDQTPLKYLPPGEGGRAGVREGGEGRREGGRERGRVGGREGEREREKEGGREVNEGGREGGR